MAVVLALDVGGTKLAAAVVDETGRILGRARVPSPTGSDPEQLYEALVTCAAAALRGADVRPGDLAGVGVAAAGPMVWPSGEVSPLNMPAWRGFPLRKRLAEEFESDRVLIHNDAVGLTVGEHWKGAGAGTANLLGITVSTGVGGGLILAGRLYHGTSGNPGQGSSSTGSRWPRTPPPGTPSPSATWPGRGERSGRPSRPAPTCSTCRSRPSSVASPGPAPRSGSHSSRPSPPMPASRSPRPAASSPASSVTPPACSARPRSCSSRNATAGTPTRPPVTRMGFWLQLNSGGGWSAHRSEEDPTRGAVQGP